MTATITLGADEFRAHLNAAGLDAPVGMDPDALPAGAEGEPAAAHAGLPAAVLAPEVAARVLRYTDGGLVPVAWYYAAGDAAVRLDLPGGPAVRLTPLAGPDGLLEDIRAALAVRPVGEEYRLKVRIDTRDIDDIVADVAGGLRVPIVAILETTGVDVDTATEIYDAIAVPVWRGRVIFEAVRDGRPARAYTFGAVQGQEHAYLVQPDETEPGMATLETLQAGALRAALRRAWDAVA